MANKDSGTCFPESERHNVTGDSERLQEIERDTDRGTVRYLLVSLVLAFRSDNFLPRDTRLARLGCGEVIWRFMLLARAAVARASVRLLHRIGAALRNGC